MSPDVFRPTFVALSLSLMLVACSSAQLTHANPPITAVPTAVPSVSVPEPVAPVAASSPSSLPSHQPQATVTPTLTVTPPPGFTRDKFKGFPAQIAQKMAESLYLTKFNEIDKDKDGRWNQAELASYLKLLPDFLYGSQPFTVKQIAISSAAELLAQYDTDKSGLLTKTEVTYLIKDVLSKTTVVNSSDPQFYSCTESLQALSGSTEVVTFAEIEYFFKASLGIAIPSEAGLSLEELQILNQSVASICNVPIATASPSSEPVVPIAQMALSPNVGTIYVQGESIRFVPTLKDAQGHLLDPEQYPLDWRVQDPSLFSVDSRGLVTALRLSSSTNVTVTDKQSGLSVTATVSPGSTSSSSSSSGGGGGGGGGSTTTVTAPLVITAVPTISNLSPAIGSSGHSVTITGTGFDTTPGNNTVMFGTTVATVVAATTTALTTTAPRLSAGSYNITVTVAGQTSNTSAFILGYTVSTYAGDGTSGTTDATGTAARFSAPQGIARDSVGNLFVTDQNSHRIRKINTAGVVTTLAGSMQGFSDGAGTVALFKAPQSIVIDSAGNLFVTDQGNHRIRKIDTAGVVTTVAGNTQGFSDATGTAALFDNPQGITLDSEGNLFVSDTGNNCVRKINTAGVVTTIAGGLQGSADGVGTLAQFMAPQGLTLDSAGNLLVADLDNHRIRKINTAGVVTTIVGGLQGSADGIGSAAQFSNPRGVTIDTAGILYVIDTINHHIRRMDTDGTVITIAGSNLGFSDGVGTAAWFNMPMRAVVDSAGILYIVDSSNHRIRKLAP